MFVPIGDAPHPRGQTAWVTYALIAANVLVYVVVTMPLGRLGVDPSDPLLGEYLQIMLRRLPPHAVPHQFLQQISAYDLFIFRHGYKPGSPEISDLFSSLFLHGGLGHLVGNMLFLWIYGRNVEYRLGVVPYLLAYVVTGVVATLAFAFFAGNSNVPLVGASGAISGVLGLYFLMFPTNTVKVLVALFPIFFNVIRLPARLVLGFYVIIDNLLPFMIAQDSSIAYGAHLGGFGAGLGLAWLGHHFGWLGLGEERAPQGGRSPWYKPQSELDTLQSALSRGDHERVFESVLTLTPEELAHLDVDDIVAIARWLAQRGYPHAGIELLRRALRNLPARPVTTARLRLALGQLLVAQGQVSLGAQHLLAVFEYQPDALTQARARATLESLGFDGR